MADSGFVAVGALAMHGREHVVVIRPNTSGLMLHTLFFANEVSQPEAAADNNLVSDKELGLAKILVNAGTAPFDPAKLKDTFKEKILQVIERRAETAVPSTRNESPKRAAVVDMMDALRRSLDAVRKPAQSEGAAPAPRKKKSRRANSREASSVRQSRP